MMAARARLTGDAEPAAKILAAPHPGQVTPVSANAGIRCRGYDGGMSPATALLLHGFASGPASMWRFREWLAELVVPGGGQGAARARRPRPGR